MLTRDTGCGPCWPAGSLSVDYPDFLVGYYSDPKTGHRLHVLTRHRSLCDDRIGSSRYKEGSAASHGGLGVAALKPEGQLAALTALERGGAGRPDGRITGGVGGPGRGRAVLPCPQAATSKTIAKKVVTRVARSNRLMITWTTVVSVRFPMPPARPAEAGENGQNPLR